MVNNQSWLQRILFNNSTKAVVRQRFSPFIIDPQYHPMRNLKKLLTKAKAQSKDNGIVIDIGCGSMPYKKLFSGWKYIGVDEYSEADEVKKVNIEKPFFVEEADFVLCSEVLEHSYHFGEVAHNIYKNLKNGGVAFVSVPFAYEIHGWDYHDYFRYTPESLQKIFHEFSSVEIKATNTYVATLVQKWNNVVFYLPLPYIIKIPFFFLNNLLYVLVEFVTKAVLKILRVHSGSLLRKLLFSYPINFVCIIKK